jgi:hypothetical protein
MFSFIDDNLNGHALYHDRRNRHAVTFRKKSGIVSFEERCKYYSLCNSEFFGFFRALHAYIGSYFHFLKIYKCLTVGSRV